jgi:glc operon protein GlcG
MKLSHLYILVVFWSIHVAAADLSTPATAPNPDFVPDVMPNDIPYGTPVLLEQANRALAVGVAEAKKRNWKLNLAIVDSGGHLVSFNRMDGAQLASIAISEHKARAAVIYRRETKSFEKSVNLDHTLSVLSLDGVIASRGGIPIIVDGKIIGAVGCSGGTGSQDEVICKTMIEALK